MRYRVDELAARCGVSVDTLRFYQAKGLLDRPTREGRVAWYDDRHVERVERIRELKARGFTLAMIARLDAGELDPGEEALAGALAGPLPGEDVASEEQLGLADLAERTGMSLVVLEAVEREGMLVPRGDGDRPYTTADVDAVQAGLALLGAGVPLSELLALARRQDEAMQAIAEHAVDLFARYVRDPIRGSAACDEEASQRMVDALHAMLPAAGAVVAHHFRRRLLAAARARIERDSRSP
ncbi:MAG: MerR family transcriptional regulator [Egibacteraceae bacterium]